MSEEKIIDLQINKTLLEEIVSGKRKRDYRNLSRYNFAALCRWVSKEKWTTRKDLTHIRFVSGLTDKRKFAKCEIEGIFVEKFVKQIPEGMKPGSMAITIYIRQVVEHNL